MKYTLLLLALLVTTLFVSNSVIYGQANPACLCIDEKGRCCDGRTPPKTDAPKTDAPESTPAQSKCYLVLKNVTNGKTVSTEKFFYICDSNESFSQAQEKCMAKRGLNVECYLPDGEDEKNLQSDSVTTNSARPLPDDSDDEADARARERARAYEAQKGKRNPSSSTSKSALLTQRPGESDEDFRARQRAAAYEAQKKEQKQEEEQLPQVDEWTKEDAKKYPGADKVRWERASCEVSMGGAKGCQRLPFTATITDKTGWVASQGAYMQISNPNRKYPLYFGIGTGLRDKLEPGETRIVELPPQYVPTNPSQRLALSPRVQTIEVRYVPW